VVSQSNSNFFPQLNAFVNSFLRYFLRVTTYILHQPPSLMRGSSKPSTQFFFELPNFFKTLLIHCSWTREHLHFSNPLHRNNIYFTLPVFPICIRIIISFICVI